jgi:hypothetical protein
MYMPAAVGPLRGNNMALGVANNLAQCKNFAKYFPAPMS